MRLCYSKASFVGSYERANMEAFLDGHVRAFEYFGGVPKRLAYDNLKSAVIQVGKGRHRRLNKRFRELRSWYLFGAEHAVHDDNCGLGHVMRQNGRANADSDEAPASVSRDRRDRSTLATLVVRSKRREDHSKRAADVSPSHRSVIFPSQPRPVTRLAHLAPTAGVASNPHSHRLSGDAA